jgi:hypothetical protein
MPLRLVMIPQRFNFGLAAGRSYQRYQPQLPTGVPGPPGRRLADPCRRSGRIFGSLVFAYRSRDNTWSLP